MSSHPSKKNAKRQRTWRQKTKSATNQVALNDKKNYIPAKQRQLRATYKCRMSRSTLSGLARNKLRSISKSNRKNKLKKWLNFLLPAEKCNSKAEFSSLTSSRQITKKFHRTISLKSRGCLKIARLKMDTVRPRRGLFRRNRGLEI